LGSSCEDEDEGGGEGLSSDPPNAKH
jgi:hypothetical protein